MNRKSFLGPKFQVLPKRFSKPKMINVRYMINKFKLNSICLSADATIKDLIDAVNKKHTRKFVAVYNEYYEKTMDYDDLLFDYLKDSTIFYVSETDIIDLSNFNDESNIQNFSNYNDFERKDTVCRNIFSHIVEVFHKKTKLKYYAQFLNDQDLGCNSYLSSVIHGAISTFEGYCYNNGQLILLSKY